MCERCILVGRSMHGNDSVASIPSANDRASASNEVVNKYALNIIVATCRHSPSQKFSGPTTSTVRGAPADGTRDRAHTLTSLVEGRSPSRLTTAETGDDRGTKPLSQSPQRHRHALLCRRRAAHPFPAPSRPDRVHCESERHQSEHTLISEGLSFHDQAISSDYTGGLEKYYLYVRVLGKQAVSPLTWIGWWITGCQCVGQERR